MRHATSTLHRTTCRLDVGGTWARRVRRSVEVACASSLVALPLAAQRVPPSPVPTPRADTTPTSIVPLPVVPRPAARDSLKTPPISPKRAFLMSLLIPGSAQSRLKRPVASMLFASAEILSIGMARKSGQDLREARSAPTDSIPSGFTVDPTTGQAVPTGFTHNRFTPARLAARRTHYEDWIAALIFNHLISSADAYVSANLWDFNANISPSVSVTPGTKAAVISANVTF